MSSHDAGVADGAERNAQAVARAWATYSFHVVQGCTVGGNGAAGARNGSVRDTFLVVQSSRRKARSPKWRAEREGYAMVKSFLDLPLELQVGLCLGVISAAAYTAGRHYDQPWLQNTGLAIAPVAIERTATGILAPRQRRTA